MDRAHSVWVSPLGTVYGKGEAGFYCLAHKKLGHWEVSAFLHQAKVLGETQIMVSHSEYIPHHLVFLGLTSMKTSDRGRTQSRQSSNG